MPETRITFLLFVTIQRIGKKAKRYGILFTITSHLYCLCLEPVSSLYSSLLRQFFVVVVAASASWLSCRTSCAVIKSLLSSSHRFCVRLLCTYYTTCPWVGESRGDVLLDAAGPVIYASDADWPVGRSVGGKLFRWLAWTGCDGAGSRTSRTSYSIQIIDRGSRHNFRTLPAARNRPKESGQQIQIEGSSPPHNQLASEHSRRAQDKGNVGDFWKSPTSPLKRHNVYIISGDCAA